MKIGLLGFGVVGRGVSDILSGREDVSVRTVLARRDLGALTCGVTRDMQDILSDPEIDTVVEVMGGLHPAYEYVSGALKAGKNVVTSNKHLLCHYYKELNQLAQENGCVLRGTAAVGGGIPWLTNLEKAAKVNAISKISGIMNGTTNYIMDAMHRSDVDFAEILAKAQALGYAEADPSADIDGWDIQRKLIISAGVAFGVCLQEDDVPVFGIRNVTAADIKRFQAHGRTCKLIASAEKLESSVAAYVEPTLLTADALEAAVPANFNLISLEGEYCGKQSFFGQGAGRYPTAYNVVQDLVDIVGGKDGFYTDRFDDASTNNAGALHRYYVRTKAQLPALDAAREEDWDGAVVTQPVSVAHMHELAKAMLEEDEKSFFAAIS
ncbi:MAG: homoserine dehydrogenase [Pyramidobacter sp.]|nr:homoserine dehydrogenase [Pyramidobacter sp.]